MPEIVVVPLIPGRHSQPMVAEVVKEGQAGATKGRG